MNISEEHKGILNDTLDLALGIQKVDFLINPKRENSRTKGLVSKIAKEIHSIAVIKNPSKEVTTSKFPKNFYRSYERLKKERGGIKRKLSNSIKTINNRVRLSKAGKNIVGKVLNDNDLSFSSSVEKSISRENTPGPKGLPFVSFTTGKTGNALVLPEFKEYLEMKGGNYMKNKAESESDELLVKFEKVSEKLLKFRDFLENRTRSFTRAPKRRDTFLERSSLLSDSQNSIVKKNVIEKPSIFQLNVKKKKDAEPRITQSIKGFNEMKNRENERFINILNRIDLERPKVVKQKVHLIQKDNERFKDHNYSLKKFDGFRVKVDNTLKELQEQSKVQGEAYMNIIEDFRVNKYRPCEGELEILEFWRKMVRYGWVVSQKDIEDIRKMLKNKRMSNEKTDALLIKFSYSL